MAMTQHEIDGYAIRIASDLLSGSLDGGLIKNVLKTQGVGDDDGERIESVLRDIAKGLDDSAKYHKTFWRLHPAVTENYRSF